MNASDKRIEFLKGFEFDSIDYDPQGNIIVIHSIGSHTATWTIPANQSMSAMINSMQGFLRDLQALFTGV